MSNSIDSYWNANKQYLVNAASSAGIDPGDMAKIAGLESHYNPTARPISSNSHKNTVTQFDGVKAMSLAYGLGQFTNATWTSVVNEHGAKYGVKNAGHLTSAQANTPELRNDVQLQANMFAELTHDNMQRASGKGGSDIAANIYAMHNLGAGDGPVFLNAVKIILKKGLTLYFRQMSLKVIRLYMATERARWLAHMHQWDAYWINISHMLIKRKIYLRKSKHCIVKARRQMNIIRY